MTPLYNLMKFKQNSFIYYLFITCGRGKSKRNVQTFSTLQNRCLISNKKGEYMWPFICLFDLFSTAASCPFSIDHIDGEPVRLHHTDLTEVSIDLFDFFSYCYVFNSHNVLASCKLYSQMFSDRKKQNNFICQTRWIFSLPPRNLLHWPTGDNSGIQTGTSDNWTNHLTVSNETVNSTTACLSWRF